MTDLIDGLGAENNSGERDGERGGEGEKGEKEQKDSHFGGEGSLWCTVSLMQLRLSHGKSQSIWQKPTTWQKSECLGFVIGWPLPVYSGKTQGGYKK